MYLRITSYSASQRSYLQPNGPSTISRIANVPTIIGLDCSTVCPLEVIGSIIGALTVFCNIRRYLLDNERCKRIMHALDR